MSQIRFAAITSSLLARKGDAVPSSMAAEPLSSRGRGSSQMPTTPSDDSVQTTSSSTPSKIAKPHRLSITLGEAEYEKLGIAAVKKCLTRRQLVRMALELHLQRLGREYDECGCLAPNACTERFV